MRPNVGGADPRIQRQTIPPGKRAVYRQVCRNHKGLSDRYAKRNGNPVLVTVPGSSSLEMTGPLLHAWVVAILNSEFLIPKSTRGKDSCSRSTMATGARIFHGAQPLGSIISGRGATGKARQY